MDESTKLKNRVKLSHDLNRLWEKLRKEGYMVYQDEDYMENEQAPYHLYYIDKSNGDQLISVLYEDKTPEQIQEDALYNRTPYKQFISHITY